MTEQKFGRFVEVSIQRETETIVLPQLTIRALIKKSIDVVELDSAVVTVTNASRSFQKFIARPVSNLSVLVEPPFDIISVHAGYTSPAPLIFQGVIREAITHRVGADFNTRMSAYTFIDNLGLTYLEKSYVNTSPLTILLDLFIAFQWPQPRFTDAAFNTLKQSSLPSYAVESSAFRSILTLLGRYGLLLTLDEDGPLVAFSGDEIDRGPINTLPLISSDTGLIGTPTITKTGIELQTLLEPKIRPLRSFVCKSDSIASTLGNNQQRYIATSVDHDVTNRGQEFYTNLVGAYPTLLNKSEDVSARDSPS